MTLRFFLPLILVSSLFLASAPAAELPCPALGYSIGASASQHALWLCEAGRATRAFSISIGWGGWGKHRQGDHKTPLGTYPLGAPRHSGNYAIFIPIGYPTRVQRDLGFTGSAVGVHGPPRRGDSFDPSAAREDWTDGCLALATDHDIAEVASWVARFNPDFIRIGS